ncbi:uncharacterized protein AB675_3622 [Cyphellophora attinorum]|uniref:Uncharacterized protein n=1 Tax=Cyphellophora attinorum TaxID=1664694 RepID=A0A0N0NJM5_9EURO|nr:uncharacterized protein AB675_3622 [Phialophora attinorum]KPI37068.1 hypothetical protein AB675_3622 [Phialophora attinorum]
MATAFTDISVSPVTTEDPFPDLFAVTAAAFGGQTNDAFWTSIYPGWDTPEGSARGAERMKAGWRNMQHDKDGRPFTVMLQASTPTPDEQGRRIVGVAIWCQYSVVDGWGVKPLEGSIDHIREKMGLAELYPDDEDRQRYVARGWQCLTADRCKAIQEASTREIPATFVLDILAVHPDARSEVLLGDWRAGDSRKLTDAVVSSVPPKDRRWDEACTRSSA